MRQWIIVSNPASGQQRAQELTEQVAARLRNHGIQYRVLETREANAGVRIGRDLGQHFVKAPLRIEDSELSQSVLESDSNPVLCVIGGDGSLHELVNGIMSTWQGEAKAPVLFVLVPAGTANALYHSTFPQTCGANSAVGDYDRFLSVEAGIRATLDEQAGTLTLPTSLTNALPLSILEVHVGANTFYSHVVVSTALHAHILETASSQEMRKAHPGTERFRKAAEMHFGTRYASSLRLLPFEAANNAAQTSESKRSQTIVQRWSSSSGSWECVSHESILVEDTLTYFVASLVDRFEQKFVITPLSSAKTRPSNAVDVLLVRARNKAADAERLLKVLTAAYQEGAHIRLQEDGSDASEGDPSEAVVEYYRTGGFEWSPVSCPLDDRRPSTVKKHH